ncbi:DUF4251 domain-containing protein [uncultured Winogradskyella sp.]|uniref:DUF4251 domain-containing protein n=1 Tax=uncultured Winogradskyella sp. TaxID=395353 RepID=UPI002630FA00|nr:DUF4251 domain-containing protein [uncultured Winogradskyella sp.]
MKKLILIALIFSLSAGSIVTAQTKQTQKERFQPIYNITKSTIKSDNYQFVANVIYNDEGRETLDGELNNIQINKSSVSGRLNGFSKDRMILSINEDNSKISVDYNDEKQEVLIDIDAISHKITIEVKPNGNAFLVITKMDGNELKYGGKLVKL